VAEGVHMLRRFMTPSDYLNATYRVLVRRASMGIITFHLYALPRENAWRAPLSTYYDNVLYLYAKGGKLTLEPLRVWGELAPSEEPVLAGSLKADCRSVLMEGLNRCSGPESSRPSRSQGGP
ncbi:MAG: hypothetical protein GU345_03725, partial [Acidilobus sp.]|nr:hypothetical protein [Acidilobus sp.]